MEELENKYYQGTENRKQKKRRLLILLLICSIFSFCLAIFLYGRVSGVSDYYGQLIDTIVINPDSRTEELNALTIYGTVIFSNGDPYQNGVVELRSDPKYTTTDNEGFFTYENVEAGIHTISVIENDAVLASCELTIEKKADLTDVITVEEAIGGYLIQLPANNVVLEIYIVLDGDELNISQVHSREPDPEVSYYSTDTGEPENSYAPDASDTPDNTEIPKKPENSNPPKNSGTSGGGLMPTPNKSNILVGDDYSTDSLWTQISSVDIFAPREGNVGVKRIEGENVISPGTYGKYIFRLKNPESSTIEYSILLAESDNNVPSLPLKYRLCSGISGSDYIGGSEWQDAEDLAVDSTTLMSGKTAYFTLEWKWVTSSDSEDTAIGMQSGSPSYIMSIIIKAYTK